jgi:hypothetical protein
MLAFESTMPNTAHIELVNILGQVVLSETRQVYTGSNTIELDISGLEPGNYVLGFRDQQQHERISIVR